MYRAVVFFPGCVMQTMGKSPEAALGALQNDTKRSPLTYRSTDGMVYYNGSQTPCGVVFPLISNNRLN